MTNQSGSYNFRSRAGEVRPLFSWALPAQSHAAMSGPAGNETGSPLDPGRASYPRQAINQRTAYDGRKAVATGPRYGRWINKAVAGQRSNPYQHEVSPTAFDLQPLTGRSKSDGVHSARVDSFKQSPEDERLTLVSRPHIKAGLRSREDHSAVPVTHWSASGHLCGCEPVFGAGVVPAGLGFARGHFQ